MTDRVDKIAELEQAIKANDAYQQKQAKLIAELVAALKLARQSLRVCVYQINAILHKAGEP